MTNGAEIRKYINLLEQSKKLMENVCPRCKHANCICEDDNTETLGLFGSDDLATIAIGAVGGVLGVIISQIWWKITDSEAKVVINTLARLIVEQNPDGITISELIDQLKEKLKDSYDRGDLKLKVYESALDGMRKFEQTLRDTIRSHGGDPDTDGITKLKESKHAVRPGTKPSKFFQESRNKSLHESIVRKLVKNGYSLHESRMVAHILTRRNRK
jgi:hypothetical protein